MQRPPKRGRPPLPAARRLSASLTIRLGRQDRRVLTELAALLAASEGEVVRRALHALAAALARDTE